MLKKEPKIIGKLFGFTGVAYGGIISGSGSFWGKGLLNRLLLSTGSTYYMVRGDSTLKF